MIHLVTALDQQVTVLEGKLHKSLASEDTRRRHLSAEISRDDVLKIVRETLPDQQENMERGEVQECSNGFQHF